MCPASLSRRGRVSIHAPAWGATPCVHRRSRLRACFDPRSRVGSDSRSLPMRERLKTFRSTLPRGERRASSRSPCPTHPVSIHAPAWGATQRGWRSDQCIERFDPRSRVGSDAMAMQSPSIFTQCFDPRSRVGSDRLGRRVDSACGPFRSTLPRGERQYTVGTMPTAPGFDPRSRVGSDISE